MHLTSEINRGSSLAKSGCLETALAKFINFSPTRSFRDDLRPARHLGFGRLDAPRLMRHTAQRDAPCPIPLHDGCDRDQRECVRSAVADLAIDLLSTDRRR